MRMLEAIAQILADKGVGRLGVDIFIHTSPQSKAPHILLLPSIDGVERDENIPGWRKGEFRIVVRDPRLTRANATAERIIEHIDLHRVSAEQCDFQRIRATHDPISFPLPNSDMQEIIIPMWAAWSVKSS